MSLTFRPLEWVDLPLIGHWLAQPHIGRWWHEAADPVAVEASYGPLINGSDPTEGFIVVLDENAVGFIQRYRLDDNPEWQRAVAVGVGDIVGAGIDYLIGEEALTGKGLGRRMIAAFIDETWIRYLDISAIVVAVQQDNQASWRALEGAGFHRVWGGMLDSDDPSDEGPDYLYVRARPVA